MSENISVILEAIQEGKCVLVLGPEVCHFEGKNFDESIKSAYEYYYDKVIDNSERRRFSKIAFSDFSFIKEELMSLKSQQKEEMHIYRFAKWYFEQRKEWEQYFRQIAQLPIPLIISLLPDDNLQTAFEEIFADKPDGFSVSRYSRTNKDVPVINQIPSKEHPLIYKLLGDLERYDATFTFDDWFGYFKNIFGKQPLPEKIEFVLQNNPVFVFLGVRFEKWYIQLLIRLLISESNGNLIGGERYSMVHSAEDDVDILVWDRFQLQFEGEKPADFLQEVYNACKEHQLLRIPKRDKETLDGKVFISYNHNDQAIALRVQKDLEALGLTVIIDTDNPIGYEIPDFINQSIAKCDFILQLISQHFLTSGWVAQESLKAFHVAELTGKRVLPCQIDDALNDSMFREKAMGIFDAKLKELKESFNERLEKEESTKDLEDERSRVLSLKKNYDDIMAEFKDKNRGDLTPDNYVNGFEQLVKSIKHYVNQ